MILRAARAAAGGAHGADGRRARALLQVLERGAPLLAEQLADQRSTSEAFASRRAALRRLLIVVDLRCEEPQ